VTAPRTETGTVADEAARLAEALQAWATTQAGVPAAGLLGALDGHVATGAPECRLCPLCRFITVARDAGPEVYDHLSDAMVALLHAVRALAEAYRDSSRPAGVERIDLDDSGLEDDGWD
jgi:hypothetical protein